jgi:hypothetical protein
MQVSYEKVAKKILEQREEILLAFSAKYGFNPDEIEQVVKTINHEMIWFVRKKENATTK